MKVISAATLSLICFSLSRLLFRVHAVCDGFDSTYATLSYNVNEIAISGSPGHMVLVKDTAVPVIVSNGVILGAAGCLEDGRVFGFAHGAIFISAMAENDSGVGQFLLNLAQWLGQSSNPAIGVYSTLTALGDFLSGAGYSVQVLTPSELASSGVNVYFVPSNKYGDSQADLDAINGFIVSGGGVAAAHTTWAWNYPNGFTNLPEYPGNSMFKDSGVIFRADYSFRSASPPYPMPVETPPTTLNAAIAVTLLTDEGTNPGTYTAVELQDASATVIDVVNILIPDEAFTFYFDLLDALRVAVGDALVLPSADAPLVPADDPLSAAVVAIDLVEGQTVSASRLRAHPAAADFPGEVPASVSTASKVVSVQGTYSGMDSRRSYADWFEAEWTSTGLYASPGAVVTVTLPDGFDVPAEGLAVLIGGHSDSISSKSSWVRMPYYLTREWALTTTVTEVGNQFGGLVYVTVAGGMDLGEFDVLIEGAVPALTFVYGETTQSEWDAAVADATASGAAPWAEFVSHLLVLTVPLDAALTVTDPVALSAFWVSVVEADNDLLGMSTFTIGDGSVGGTRQRAERFTFDRAISVGWMHSGYPIMAHIDNSAYEVVDLDLMQSEGMWGPFHELGHNYQWVDWVIPHTTEVSCNLYTVYVMETVVGNTRGSGMVDPVYRAEITEAYVEAGAVYDEGFAASPALGLACLLQLKEGFGFEMYKQVFLDYLSMPAGTIPSDAYARVDPFITRLSAAAGVNLGPWADAWGLPISQDARDEMSALPVWTDDPMLKYYGYCGDGVTFGTEQCDGSCGCGDDCTRLPAEEAVVACADDDGEGGTIHYMSITVRLASVALLIMRALTELFW